MNWLAITAIAIFSRAFYSVSTKSLSTNVRTSAQTQAVLLPLIAAGFALMLIPFLGFNVTGLGDAWLVAVVLAASQGLGNIIYFYGQNYIDSGVTQIALSSKLVWTALLAIPFLGTTYSAVQIIGMVLLLVGVLLVQHIGKNNKDIRKGMLLIALSAVSFSVFAIAGADIADKINPVAYLLVTYLGASLFALIAGLKHLRKDMTYLLKTNTVKSLKHFSYAAGTSTLYFTLVYYAYREAPDPGIVAVLVNAQVITTVFVAIFILKEREHLPRKLLGGLTILFAAYLISGV